MNPDGTVAIDWGETYLQCEAALKEAGHSLRDGKDSTHILNQLVLAAIELRRFGVERKP